MKLSSLQFLAGLLFGAVAAYFAQKNKKNPYTWFFIGFFFGLIGLFFLFYLPNIKRKKELTSPAPLFRGPTDKLWFYLDPTHKQVGPVRAEAIQEALKDGNLSGESYVWYEDLSDWKQIRDLN